MFLLLIGKVDLLVLVFYLPFSPLSLPFLLFLVFSILPSPPRGSLADSRGAGIGSPLGVRGISAFQQRGEESVPWVQGESALLAQPLQGADSPPFSPFSISFPYYLSLISFLLVVSRPLVFAWASVASRVFLTSY